MMILTILGDIILGCMLAGFYALAFRLGGLPPGRSRRTASSLSTGMEVRGIEVSLRAAVRAF